MASEPTPQAIRGGAAEAISPVQSVAAAEFKARCLKILDDVRDTGACVVITKHGHPVAKLVPVEAASARAPFVGACKGQISYREDETFENSTVAEMDAWESNLDEPQTPLN